MKEFLKQCFRDLEALTGIRQLYFFEVDPEGERKLDICIQGILKVCEMYPYIPEEAQKKIIREQMVKDQDYEALNSRTVWKWFDKAKDIYWNRKEERQEIETTTVELSEETQKLVREWQSKLLGFSVPDAKMEMERIKKEDKERLEGKEIRKADLSRKAFTVPIEDEEGKEIGVIENVYAENAEQAKEIVLKMIERGNLRI